jgi:nuclear transcription Y subunit beta
MATNQMPEHAIDTADSVLTDPTASSNALMGNQQGAEDNHGETIREQDRLLPIANVARIMKMAIPTNAKIAKDAKETVQECVSELISFITSEYALFCYAKQKLIFS